MRLQKNRSLHELYPGPRFVLMKSLDLTDEVKADIHRDNAVRLFGFEMK